MPILFNSVVSGKKSQARTKVRLLLLVLVAAAGLGCYLLGPARPGGVYQVALVWIVTVLFLLWFGNRFIYQLLNQSFPWTGHPATRFFLQLFLSTSYSLLCINATYYFFRVQTTPSPPTLEQVMVLNVYGLLFIIPVLSLNFGVYFMMQWKKAYEQSDRLKQENLRSQLESLRMHLDPHFLFNNLNILSSLIEKDPQDAQAFLDKFADVYRYVLQYKKEELVPLEVELEFIQAYIFLLRKRFGSQLQVVIDIPEALAGSVCIPPLSLQLLLENATKHNVISEARPLQIAIRAAGNNWLEVANSLHPKVHATPGLGQTGLDNIRKRYGYLSDNNIQVSQTDTEFLVRMPLLEMLE